MQDAFSEMELILGNEGIRKLSSAKIAVFGIGSVGSYIVEALARCGVASLTLVDGEQISLTNINRQLFALHSTIGKRKVDIAKERIRDIDENILVNTYETFYNQETADLFDLGNYDYVVDAIGTVESKLLLIERAKNAGTPIISCLDTENRLDPSKFEIADIAKSTVSPLAKTMRAELRKKGIRKVKVLFSKEKPLSAKRYGVRKNIVRQESFKGSVSFVPGVAGLLVAGEVVRDLLKEEKSRSKK